jgi:hypothetical protein
MSESETKPAPSNRKFYLLVAAFLLAAVLMGVFSAGRGKSSVDRWKDEMRSKGEKFTVAERWSAARWRRRTAWRN